MATKEGLGVPDECKIMTNNSESSYMKRIKGVFDFYNSFYGAEGECNDNSYSAYMKMMENTTFDAWNDYEIGWCKFYTSPVYCSFTYSIALPSDD